MSGLAQKIAGISLFFLLVLAGCQSASPAPFLVEKSVSFPAEESVASHDEQNTPKPVAVSREQTEALDKAVEEIAKQFDVLGYSLAVFDKEEILYQAQGGYARTVSGPFLFANGSTLTPSNLESATLVEKNTKFRVASISKMVTALLAMQLVDSGALSLQSSVADLVHPKLENPAFADQPVTLWHLLTHTSGIIDGSAYNWALEQMPFPSLDLLLENGNIHSGKKPGESYAYSNFAFGLVCAMIEKTTGTKFYDYANEALFSKMGMDAAFLTDGLSDKTSVAAMIKADPLSWGNMQYAYNKIPLGQMYLLGQGELYISAEDLAKITMILAGGGSYRSERYLSEEACRQIATPQATNSKTNLVRGLAVHITDELADDTTLCGHQGNAYGTISCVYYDPLQNRGVVFLTNGANQAKLANEIYRVNEQIVKAVWQTLF